MKSSNIIIVSLLFSFLLVQTSCNKGEENTNQKPVCTITAPVDGQIISKGTNVTISVDATDSDGIIDEVRIFVDDVGLGSVGFPFNYDWQTSNVSIGNHIIKAAIVDDDGNPAFDEITVDIELGGIPSADFIADITVGVVPLTVDFSDQSLNNPTAWEWDFGDGYTSAEQNPLHTYQDTGSFTVQLTVSNCFGSDFEIKMGYISVENIGGTGEPCPGIPTFTYQGQIYNTVLIGFQCWMKENLNYAIGNSWCYDDDPVNCNTYGRLYDWATIMNGEASSNSVPSGVQGICPYGWHVPSDEEWKILEGTADTQYGVGDSVWDEFGDRGHDVGKRLKSISGWEQNSGTDAFNFFALPGGFRSRDGFGSFHHIMQYAYYWSSTSENDWFAWYRLLHYDMDKGSRYGHHKEHGFSLRCVKD